MPVMSGVQATQEIRSRVSQNKQHPIIIALTANAFAEDIKHYLSSGFNSVVTKPIKLEVLQSALEAVVPQ
jgi:CheY-like chemotaxis protein